MKKYKYRRPFRPYKLRVGICNLIFNLFAWAFLVAIDFIKFAVKMDINIIKWMRNRVHYRGLEYTEFQMRKMIKRMTPREFEIFCAELFRANGYKALLTQETQDGGKDVIIKDTEGNVTYVECKHYDEEYGFMVGREIIQKLAGCMLYEKADFGIVFTTGKIHQNAKEYIRVLNNIDIYTFDDIMQMLYNIDTKKIPSIFAKTFNSEVVQNIWQLEY